MVSLLRKIIYLVLPSGQVLVVDVAVTPGNVNDSEPCLSRIESLREHIGLDVQMAGADSAYGTSMIY